MKCPACYTDNPRDAIFCKNCGCRLDGTIVCSACHKNTPGDGKFCVYCGSNLEVTQQNRTLTVEENQRVIEPIKTSPTLPRMASIRKESTVFSWVSFGLSCAVIFLSVLFFFLISVNATTSASGVSISTGVDIYIYYFFGEAYTALFESGVTNALMKYGYIGPVIGTISVCLSLIAIIVTTIIGGLGIYRYLQSDEKTSPNMQLEHMQCF